LERQIGEENGSGNVRDEPSRTRPSGLTHRGPAGPWFSEPGARSDGSSYSSMPQRCSVPVRSTVVPGGTMKVAETLTTTVALSFLTRRLDSGPGSKNELPGP